MNYSMLRVFLTERKVLSLLNDVPKHSRQEYLTEIFSKNIPFIGRGEVSYSYVFIGEVESFLLGRVGRMRSEPANDGPETGFADTEARLWHAVNVIIDTGGNDDGQKIAVEQSQDVGSPLSIARSMIEHINGRNTNARWHLDVNPITEALDFWDVVEAYKGKITELDFTFVAPNIFGSKDKTSEALKRLRDDANMQTTTVKINNPDGALEADSEPVREAIDYTSEGGGSAKVKVGKNVVYTSEESEVVKKVEEEHDLSIGEKNKNKWRDLIKRIFDK